MIDSKDGLPETPLAEGMGPARHPVRHRRLARACAILGVVAAAAQMPARAKEPCKVDRVEMPVTVIGSRAIANVTINGTQVPLMVDSGAYFSFLTDAAAEQLQLPVTAVPRGESAGGLTGTVEVHLTKVKSLQLLKGEIPNVEFLVGGNDPGSGAMGLMGRNILALADTEYDLAHGAIRFMFPSGDCKGQSMAYWAGESPVVELELLPDPAQWRPAIKAAAKLNGNEISVVLDTGMTSSQVTLAAARRVGIEEAAMTPTYPQHGVGRGEAKAWIATVGRFELGGEVVSNNRMLIADYPFLQSDMLLGIDFFLAHRIYVEKSQHRMFITYNGGPVFAFNHLPAAQAPAAASPGAAEPEDDDQPTTADGYARRGAASAARRDFVHALADLDKACQLAPQAADYFRLRLDVHAALKQWPKAMQDAEMALRLDPALSAARFARAQLRARAGDRDGALEDLGALDRTLASQAQLRRDMAQLYTRLDHQELALPEWDFWIASHRNDVELGDALNSRCWTRVMLAVELDKAMDDCNGAVDRQATNHAFLDSRAWLHLRRGEFREALADYEASLKIKPDSAWSLYGRGIARTRLGDIDQGRADVDAARRLLPTIDARTARFGLAFDQMRQTAAPPSNSPSNSSSMGRGS